LLSLCFKKISSADPSIIEKIKLSEDLLIIKKSLQQNAKINARKS